MTACSSIQMTTLHNAALPGDPIVFSFHIIYKPILRKIKESIDRKFRHEASLSYCSHITLNSQSTKFVISAFPPNLPGFAVYLIHSVYLSYSACSAFSLVSASPIASIAHIIGVAIGRLILTTACAP